MPTQVNKATTARALAKPFEVEDYTSAIISVPNQWGLINEMGIFTPEHVSQNVINVESINSTLGIVGDKFRGERNNVNRDDGRVLRAYAIPHFPLDDAIYPRDIQGKRAYGSEAVESLDAVMTRKLTRIRKSHSATLEAARAWTLTTGTIYAPNGTIVGNYYTDFGVTRKEVDVKFGTVNSNLIAASEIGIAHLQDNIMTGDNISGLVVLCSPEFFGQLISHATVAEAFKFYSSTQEPLRNRQGGATALYRRFEYGSVTYIEYRGSYAGKRLIPAGDAYMIPTGTSDTFMSYFGPAEKFATINTAGEELYAWVYKGLTDQEITIETEANHLHMLRRPQAVVRMFSSN